MSDANATVLCEEPSRSAGRGFGSGSCLHDHELHLIGSAPACLRVGSGASEETHTLAPGAVLLLGPLLPRTLRPAYRAAPDDGLVLRFSDEPLRRGAVIFPELSDVGPLLSRARQGVHFVGLGAETLSRLRRLSALHGLARFSAFTAVLNELAQWTDYRPLARTLVHADAAGPGRAMHVQKALDHIRDNYAQPLSLSEVSALVGTSRTALSRSFRRATGKTFTDFIIGLRLAKACRLLTSTRQHVSSICYEVGFNNLSNFNRHFRRLEGMTPGEFRARHAGAGR
ncbi:AraC-like DNA-binding protein [Variovorax paradoxus]|uniref:helix-turn-helix domain-containing protein n=1 Tax=Variovorax atrisoli TaxID=3394203 RepID=UPI00119C282A|nr:AraC family transcriptional regulator [Variovorax paradoxus]MDR6524146.1 AraC-like DNA-binding protein [Variovorax paradoxus]